jgi:uncharacterized protein (DUF1330 family)
MAITGSHDQTYRKSSTYSTSGTLFVERFTARRIMVAMPAYVISEIEIPDESQGQRYRDLAAASIACHGGRYLVRGAQPEVPEGRGPAAQRLVVVEFPTMDRLRSW